MRGGLIKWYFLINYWEKFHMSIDYPHNINWDNINSNKAAEVLIAS